MAKKQKCPEFENHERWLVSYADMVTLLFAVFVVLYATKQNGAKAVEKVAGSMQESFNMPLEDIPKDRQAGPSETGWGIFDHFKGTQIREPLSPKYPANGERSKVIDEEMKKFDLQIEDRLYGPNKFKDLGKTGQERVISVHRNNKGFKLRMLARHFYESGQIQVRREALPELDVVIGMLKELGRPITIEGHTDSVPATGNMTNWEISSLRATNILKYMVGKHSFPATKLSVAGYADMQPIAHNGTESGRSLNRRIEIQVHYDIDTATEPE